MHTAFVHRGHLSIQDDLDSSSLFSHILVETMCLNHTVYMPGEMDLLQVLFKKFEKDGLI